MDRIIYCLKNVPCLVKHVGVITCLERGDFSCTLSSAILSTINKSIENGKISYINCFEKKENSKEKDENQIFFFFIRSEYSTHVLMNYDNSTGHKIWVNEQFTAICDINKPVEVVLKKGLNLVVLTSKASNPPIIRINDFEKERQSYPSVFCRCQTQKTTCGWDLNLNNRLFKGVLRFFSRRAPFFHFFKKAL